MRTTVISSFRSAIVLFFILLMCNSTIIAQDTTDTDSLSENASSSYPEENEVAVGDHVHELPQGIPIAAFSKGGKKEMELENFITEQKVAGLLILQNGKIRLERYALDHNQSNRWSSLSVAKSVTSTLVGAAIKDGYIRSVDDYVTDYLPDLKGSAYDSVKIRHLITMTTGVKWSEDYTDPNGDIARFATDSIEPGMDATVSYMKHLPAVAEPGKKFLYSTGETHLLGALVSAATGKTLSEYLSLKIWKPYGMEQSATWTLNRTGQELAGCCLQMTLRDFARFGQFVLEDGRIKGQSILPDHWLETATKIQVPLWPGGGYGYGWWILGRNSFDALGIYGQRIHIDPSRQLVIAVNSAWPEADSDQRQTAFANFLRSVKSEIGQEEKGN